VTVFGLRGCERPFACLRKGLARRYSASLIVGGDLLLPFDHVRASAPTTTARAWRWTLGLVGLLTAVRLAGLFLSPVELYPEEAQYWLWSRHLAFGYFSKPPMIAWTIWATTRLGGSEAFVRLAAPLAHAAAALMLARTGRRLYGGWTGFWAAMVYSLAPGVQLSAAVVATDCLVMAASSLAVWGYAAWLTSDDPRGRLGWAAAIGAALGLGVLSKYAILYIALGLLLHAAVSPEARRRWRGAEVALVVGLALAVAGPNLLWNAAHGFQTVAHTAHDAALGGAQPHAGRAVAHADVLNTRAAPGFLLAQLGVFGPIPFVVLAGGGVWLLLRRRGEAADVALGALAAPALLIILGEAILARANANWAAVAYVPGSVLVAAWLSRWRAQLWLGLTAASEGALLLLFLVAAMSPRLADRFGAANSFKRARGWAATAELVTDEARRLGPASLSAVAVDDRFTFNALGYYTRADWPASAPQLTMWVRKSRPGNEAETVSPLRDGSRVLFVDIGEGKPGPYRAEAERDFTRVEPIGAWKVWMDPRHYRSVDLFLGEGYRRRPRDPKTGLPVPA
jgi:4-amino-4-deoxy-L-arabinose transferase-like glycosyltransferase